MTASQDLRIAVLGVGLMGADHVERLARRTAGARPTVLSDASLGRAEAVAGLIDGGRAVADPYDAIADPDVDAVVIATPGPTHEGLVLACLERGLPVLCEKPLTTDVESALRIVRAEQALGRALVQVGFMRRFDPEYAALRELIGSGGLGSPLLMHCVHRNPSVHASFTSELIVRDSVVHEVDATRFLFGEEIVAVRVLTPRTSAVSPPGLQDPQLVILETAGGRIVDVEAFATTGVAYEVRTEVVGEHGSAMIGLDRSLVRTSADGRRGGQLAATFLQRFAAAYDIQLQRWVDAARRGGIDGPGVWDGYAATAVCDAGVQSLRTGERVEVRLAPREPVA